MRMTLRSHIAVLGDYWVGYEFTIESFDISAGKNQIESYHLYTIN